MSSLDEPNSIVLVLSGPIGVGTVDALARLQLEVRRLGGCVRLRAIPDELGELIDLVGLKEVLCVEPDLIDACRQPEEREEPLGIEEETDP